MLDVASQKCLALPKITGGIWQVVRNSFPSVLRPPAKLIDHSVVAKDERCPLQQVQVGRRNVNVFILLTLNRHKHPYKHIYKTTKINKISFHLKTIMILHPSISEYFHQLDEVDCPQSQQQLPFALPRRKHAAYLTNLSPVVELWQRVFQQQKFNNSLMSLMTCSEVVSV